MSDRPCHLIIIPALNEQSTLPGTVEQLQSLPDGFEILIVDDGSTDGTAEVAQKLAATSRLPLRVCRLPMNLGIGGAVQTGFRFAERNGGYHYVLQFDADGQHDVSYIEALIRECDDQRLDLCIGSRFLAADRQGFQSTPLRRVGIRFFAGLISLLARTRVTDPTSGFRCMGPRAWRRFAETYPDDYPEPESLFWSVRNNLRTGEIPVRMFARQGGVSSIQFMRSMYYMLKVTLAIMIDRLRPKELFE